MPASSPSTGTCSGCCACARSPPFTADTAPQVLAHTTVALFHGLALQHTVKPELSDTVYDGPGGEWTPAQSFLAILDMVSEANPEH